MAVTSKVYGPALHSFGHGEIVLSAGVKVMLCTSSYTPNQDTHRYLTDVSGEVSATGYTSGGVTLTGITEVYDAATKTFKFSADAAVWTGSTITARYAVFYSTGTLNPLICYWDFGADQSSSSGAFVLTPAGAGIVVMTAA